MKRFDWRLTLLDMGSMSLSAYHRKKKKSCLKVLAIHLVKKKPEFVLSFAFLTEEQGQM